MPASYILDEVLSGFEGLNFGSVTAADLLSIDERAPGCDFRLLTFHNKIGLDVQLKGVGGP